jgi:hypothetical protein
MKIGVKNEEWEMKGESLGFPITPLALLYHLVT